MPRPRQFAGHEVVEAAKHVFWRLGYAGTAIADLEDATGVGRSSLYHAFGSKRGLFAAAVDRYVATFVDPMLHGMEAGRPGVPAITQYLATLSEVFSAEEDLARRGCILVNTISESPTSLGEAGVIAARFPDRLQQAFRRCLTAEATNGRIPRTTVQRRAAGLSATVVGLFTVVRTQPTHAAGLSDHVRAEVVSWRRPARA